MKVAKHDTKQNKYISILTCRKRYRMEDHSTTQCNTDRSYKICSECSSPEHTWKECKAEKKTCITCNGDHSTLAMRCPKRKEIINLKRHEEQVRETTKYAEMVKKGPAKQVLATATQQPQQTNPKQRIMYLCMFHANFHNAGNPGEYGTELNKILNVNDLPGIKVPGSNPNTAAILGSLNIKQKELITAISENIPNTETGAIPKTNEISK